MFEHILSDLAIAEICMERIKDNLPLGEVIAKGKSLGKAIRLINQLDGSLDMERGGKVAQNLRALYLYMLDRLTAANVTNDARMVAEVTSLVRKIKSGWDQIVADGR
jgi:flagellar protein FliS